MGCATHSRANGSSRRPEDARGVGRPRERRGWRRARGPRPREPAAGRAAKRSARPAAPPAPLPDLLPRFPTSCPSPPGLRTEPPGAGMPFLGSIPAEKLPQDSGHTSYSSALPGRWISHPPAWDIPWPWQGPPCLSHQTRTQWQGLGLTCQHPEWCGHKQASLGSGVPHGRGGMGW